MSDTDNKLEFRVIRREQVKPGDVLLLTCPAYASKEAINEALKMLGAISQDLGTTAYLMSSDYSMTVVGADAVPSDAEHID